MSASLLRGVSRTDWSLDVDDEGHRTYTLVRKVKTDDVEDGPRVVFDCPGLSLPGVAWAFGNDRDPWAFCYPTKKVQRARSVTEGDPDTLWDVTETFSTRPLRRCQDTPIENPLNEPPKLRGSFTKFTKEVFYNRNGKPIINTAGQPLVGPETEFDDNRPTVSITLNLPTLPLSTFAPMVDTVNDSPLWGLGPRRIKLSNVTWERALYGQCFFYYIVTYEFEVNYLTFDRIVPSRGWTRAIEGSTTPATEDGDGILTAPAVDFNSTEVAKDSKGEKIGMVFLDQNGQPTSGPNAYPILISYYNQSNFGLLGIPLTL